RGRGGAGGGGGGGAGRPAGRGAWAGGAGAPPPPSIARGQAPQGAPPGTPPLSRRSFLRAGAAGVGGLLLVERPDAARGQPAEETLYNGIRLASPWPPRGRKVTLDPMPVPYLTAPPAVIPIDVGRQLFVDDFLID